MKKASKTDHTTLSPDELRQKLDVLSTNNSNLNQTPNLNDRNISSPITTSTTTPSSTSSSCSTSPSSSSKSSPRYTDTSNTCIYNRTTETIIIKSRINISKAAYEAMNNLFTEALEQEKVITITNMEQLLILHDLISQREELKAVIKNINLEITNSITDIINHLSRNREIFNFKCLILKDTSFCGVKLEIPTISVKKLEIDMFLFYPLIIAYQPTLQEIKFRNHSKSGGVIIKESNDELEILDITCKGLEMPIQTKLKKLSLTSVDSLEIHHLNLKYIDEVIIKAPNSVKVSLSQYELLCKQKITIETKELLKIEQNETEEESKPVIEESNDTTSDRKSELLIQSLMKIQTMIQANHCVMIECMEDLLAFELCLNDKIIPFAEIKKVEVGIDKSRAIFNNDGTIKEEYKTEEADLVTAFLDFLRDNQLNAHVIEENDRVEGHCIMSNRNGNAIRIQISGNGDLWITSSSENRNSDSGTETSRETNIRRSLSTMTGPFPTEGAVCFAILLLSIIVFYYRPF